MFHTAMACQKLINVQHFHPDVPQPINVLGTIFITAPSPDEAESTIIIS
jgi:hypothetical protein